MLRRARRSHRSVSGPNHILERAKLSFSASNTFYPCQRLMYVPWNANAVHDVPRGEEGQPGTMRVRAAAASTLSWLLTGLQFA